MNVDEECRILKGQLAEIRSKSKLVGHKLQDDSYSVEQALISRLGLSIDLDEVFDRIAELEAICDS